MGVVPAGPYEPMVGDPDDHRPATTWRVAVDPGTGGRVVPIAVLMEHCAPGDSIPLHRHDVDEVVSVLDGVGSYVLDGRQIDVGAGDVVFIPAGAEHGTVNTGDAPMHIHAVFPATRVRMEMLERNPRPGPTRTRP